MSTEGPGQPTQPGQPAASTSSDSDESNAAWRALEEAAPAGEEPGAATSKGAEGPLPPHAPTSTSPQYTPTWTPPPAFNENRAARRQQTTGLILVGLGLLFLAGQTGIFRWINWQLLWPLILVGFGVFLLMKQGSWRNR